MRLYWLRFCIKQLWNDFPGIFLVKGASFKEVLHSNMWPPLKSSPKPEHHNQFRDTYSKTMFHQALLLSAQNFQNFYFSNFVFKNFEKFESSRIWKLGSIISKSRFINLKKKPTHIPLTPAPIIQNFIFLASDFFHGDWPWFTRSSDRWVPSITVVYLRSCAVVKP